MKSLLFASAVVSLLASSTASAKDFLGFRLLDLEGTAVRWAAGGSGPVTVTYAFAENPMRFDAARNCEAMVPMDSLLERSGISQSVFQKEVRAAFDMWEQAANIRFRQTSDVATAGILIGAQEQPQGRAFTNVALRPDHSGEIERSLICLSPNQPWKIGFDGNLDVYDLRYTIAHEIGHAIGLDHPAPDGQVMSYRYQEKFRALQEGDISGAVALYGAKGSDKHLPSRVDTAQTDKGGAPRTPTPVICSAMGSATGC